MCGIVLNYVIDYKHLSEIRGKITGVASKNIFKTAQNISNFILDNCKKYFKYSFFAGDEKEPANL